MSLKTKIILASVAALALVYFWPSGALAGIIPFGSNNPTPSGSPAQNPAVNGTAPSASDPETDVSGGVAGGGGSPGTKPGGTSLYNNGDSGAQAGYVVTPSGGYYATFDAQTGNLVSQSPTPIQ